MPRRKPNVSEELLLNKVVLRPEKTHSRPPESLGRPFEPFLAASADSSQAVCGWYFPADAPAALALVNPPNRGTKAEALDHAALLLECGCSVLLYDYPGFGDSEGLADVRTLVGSARAVLDWARQRGILPEAAGPSASSRPPAAQGACGVGPRAGDIGLLMVGLSLGSLVAIHLAATHCRPVAGLLLDGAIEPLRALRRSFGPLGAVVAEVACSQVPPSLNSEREIRSVTCPILFVHGQGDSIGTAEEAAYLASRAKNATLWLLEDCGHLDIITRHRGEYGGQVRRFLDGLVIR